MKKKRTNLKRKSGRLTTALAFVTLLSCMFVTSAQNVYHPITDGCTWSVSDEKYRTSGDTVLDGKTYLKLYRQVGGLPFEFNLEDAEYFAAIRNDLTGKKVYAYLPAGTQIHDVINHSNEQIDTAMDVLIYDFALGIGDTLTYYVVGRTITAKVVAVRTGSVDIYVGQQGYSAVIHHYSSNDTVVYLSDNSSHHQILLHGISNATPDNVWIEGIGSIRGFDEAEQMCYLDYGTGTLLCFENNSGAEYHTGYDFDNEPNDCFSSGFGGDVPDQEMSTISIYPNPIENYLNINNLESIGLPVTVYIYNEAGNCLYSSKNTANTAVLDLSSFPSGIYFLNIYTTYQTIVRKIIKL